MTPEQILNFRKVLRLQFGPLESLFTDEDVVRYRDMLQKKVDSGDLDADLNKGIVGKSVVQLPERNSLASITCMCDKKFHSSTTHVDGRVECNHCHKDR